MKMGKIHDSAKLSLNHAYVIGFMYIINCLTSVIGHSEHTTLLIVSFDGFRHDYLDMAKQAGKKIPNFETLIQNGVLAHHMKNAFITKTFPNHWTIATGLYEEEHGVIANEMFDPLLNETFHNKPEQNRDTRWWNNGTGQGGEPLWFTNEKHHGGRSGVVFWPGSQAKGFIPKHFLPYDSAYPNESRIDQIVDWFATEEEPINLGMLYFEEPDALGHLLGPSSSNMLDMIEELDALVGYLINKLTEHNLFHSINLVITSDHGMSDIKTNDIIYLNDYINPDFYTHYGSSPIWGINPKKGNESYVYESLKKISNVDVYWKQDIPSEYHYKYNRRIQPILLVAHDHYQLAHNEEEYKNWPEKGNHGYNNSLDDMHPIFIAHGPAFRKDIIIKESFNNVDLYPLFCHILELPPWKNYGNVKNVVFMLREEETFSGTLIISLVTVGLCAALAFLISIAACRSRSAASKRRQKLTVSIHLDNGNVDGNTHLLSSDEEEIP